MKIAALTFSSKIMTVPIIANHSARARPPLIDGFDFKRTLLVMPFHLDEAIESRREKWLSKTVCSLCKTL